MLVVLLTPGVLSLRGLALQGNGAPCHWLVPHVLVCHWCGLALSLLCSVGYDLFLLVVRCSECADLHVGPVRPFRVPVMWPGIMSPWAQCSVLNSPAQPLWNSHLLPQPQPPPCVRSDMQGPRLALRRLLLRWPCLGALAAIGLQQCTPHWLALLWGFPPSRHGSLSEARASCCQSGLCLQSRLTLRTCTAASGSVGSAFASARLCCWFGHHVSL